LTHLRKISPESDDRGFSGHFVSISGRRRNAGQLQDKNAKTLFSPVFKHSQQNKCSSPKTHGKEYQTQLIFLTGYYRAF
jgi:hypothetical protein